MHSPKRMLFLDLVLSLFRLNGLLIAEGDDMTEPLGLTSARWKVIGVIALSNSGLTVPGIARVLGAASSRSSTNNHDRCSEQTAA